MKDLAHLDRHRRVLRELQVIPGIGPSLAQDLYALGIRRVADLKDRNPETLYRRLERLTHSHQDRCVLYTFRCAVYYARTPDPDPRRLRWWNWKDAPVRSVANPGRFNRSKRMVREPFGRVGGGQT